MPYRVVILEQTQSKDVWLCNHVEQVGMIAHDFLAAMLDVVRERGSTVLYSDIIKFG